jgi:hypothetical protein
MQPDPTPIEVSAALAQVRRRASLLDQASGNWSWHELWLFVPLGFSIYLGLSGADQVGSGTAGLILFGATLGGWQYHRLRARVDALTKLLTEIGHPDEA